MAKKPEAPSQPSIDFDYVKQEAAPLPPKSSEELEQELPDIDPDLEYETLTILPNKNNPNRFCVLVTKMRGSKVIGGTITEPYSRPLAFEDAKIKFVKMFSGELFEKYKKAKGI